MLVDGSYLNVLRSAGVKVRSRNSQVRAARRAAERAEAKRQRRLDREDAAYALKHGDPLPGAAKKPAAKRAAKPVQQVVEGPAEWAALARLAASVPKRKRSAPALLQQSGAGGLSHAQTPDHGAIMGGKTEDLK